MKVAVVRLAVSVPVDRETETAGRKWHGSPWRGRGWIWGRVRARRRGARLELRMEDMARFIYKVNDPRLSSPLSEVASIALARNSGTGHGGVQGRRELWLGSPGDVEVEPLPQILGPLLSDDAVWGMLASLCRGYATTSHNTPELFVHHPKIFRVTTIHEPYRAASLEFTVNFLPKCPTHKLFVS